MSCNLFAKIIRALRTWIGKSFPFTQKGMATREIVAIFKEMYDADVSPTLISKVTDAV
ncbi:TPA: transposase [Escherichia coli]|nr:transposase [Escherichia coli]HAZ3596062.1 transposase [Escherichia coli]HAZ3605122.1 transposase [Escherichia coli]HAZ3619855.1 transposase [Escherichia coli]HAZ3780073.1 transposase [Escherichia coli]